MKRKEPYETRLEMAHMHDEFIDRLENAMREGNYVEASWLCYAIFEQRIDRIIIKHILKCPRGKRGKNESPISISTRIECLKKLCKVKYGPFAEFDKTLLGEIKKWCFRRNGLIHGLVSLEHYKKYDTEFKDLAESGEPLVKRIYQEATKVRNWYNEGNPLEKFPEIRCNCKHRCIFLED